jgi:prepilin-type N-terminal cleavage/methylation domain-containing protein
MTSRSGFSLIETIIAIAICGIVLAALASVNVTSLRQARFGNDRLQATQVLDTVGRRVVGGGDTSLLPGISSTVSYDYGDLDTLLDLNEATTTDRYRVTITQAGNLTVGESTVGIYRIQVCFRAGDDEQCVEGSTLSRRAS